MLFRSPPPSLSSQEIPAGSLRPAYSALGAARSWEGGQGWTSTARPPGRKVRPWEAGRASATVSLARRGEAQAGSLPPFLALPALSRRPETLPTVPRRLGRRRTPSAQGTAPGAPAGTGRLAGTFGKTAKPLGSLGSASVSFSTSQMHPPKSFPKPSAS